MGAYSFTKKLIKKTSRRPSRKDVRTSSYGDNWSSISTKCLTLANHICKDCGKRANRAHHIIPLSRGGSNAQHNLKAVCTNCHSRYHKHLK